MKTKIAIAGMGGVGGFYGTRLANTFHNSPETEVYFFARGEHLKVIRESGLQLITDKETILAKPVLASDNVQDFGSLDLIIFCCKSYDLREIAKQFAGNIHEKTILMPLQNGVESVPLLQELFPACHCLYACVYIVSKVLEPGIVKQSGEYNAVHFGNPALSAGQLGFVSEVFKAADLNATLYDDIEHKLWEKFLFISPIATYTSAYDISIGRILEEPEHAAALRELMGELLLLATAMKKEFAADTIERNFGMMGRLPYATTSSMQFDFSGKRRTELETLTGYVVNKGKENNLMLQQYIDLYRKLSERK